MLAKLAKEAAMADESHLKILRQGVEAWNRWRKENPTIRPALSGADLSNLNLSDINLNYARLDLAKFCRTDLTRARMAESNSALADFSYANLTNASFLRANPITANFNRADLCEARLMGANLSEAYFIKANLTRANLHGASLNNANLTGADLTEATLIGVSFVETDITDAIFRDCPVYGISVWNLKGKPREQTNLMINRTEELYFEPHLTVDTLEVAQFVHLLLHYERLRDVINTITTKAVLILGRFGERKTYLEAIADRLRTFEKTGAGENSGRVQEYIPIIFDFDKPHTRTFTETVRILGHLARFIIIDITDPKSVPQETPSARTHPRADSTCFARGETAN